MAKNRYEVDPPEPTPHYPIERVVYRGKEPSDLVLTREELAALLPLIVEEMEGDFNSLPPESRKQYEDAQRSVVEARRHAERTAYFNNRPLGSVALADSL